MISNNSVVLMGMDIVEKSASPFLVLSLHGTMMTSFESVVIAADTG